jgi:hypothetical protein
MQFDSNIQIDKEHALVRVKCRGELHDAQLGEQVLRDVVICAVQEGLRSVLVDIRELTLSFSGADMMDVMIKMREEEWLKGVRIARLLTNEDFSNLLIADISESMALPLKNFTSELLAIKWLKDNK